MEEVLKTDNFIPCFLHIYQSLEGSNFLSYWNKNNGNLKAAVEQIENEDLIIASNCLLDEHTQKEIGILSQLPTAQGSRLVTDRFQSSHAAG